MAGIRTPEPLDDAASSACRRCTTQLVAIKDRLERHYRDMQDIEFTVQEGRLYILQTRSGKRTGARGGAHRGRDGARSGSIDQARPRCCRGATARLRSSSHCQLLVKTVDPSATYTAIARGLPATPAAAVGRVVFDPERRWRWRSREERSSSCARRPRPRTWPACTPPRASSPSRGGLTSHAAVVARGWGKCCVVGAGDVVVDEEHHLFRAGRAWCARAR